MNVDQPDQLLINRIPIMVLPSSITRLIPTLTKELEERVAVMVRLFARNVDLTKLELTEQKSNTPTHPPKCLVNLL